MNFLLTFVPLNIKIDNSFRFINIIIYGCGPPNYNGPAHIHLPFWLNYYFQRCVFYNIYVLSNLLNFLQIDSYN